MIKKVKELTNQELEKELKDWEELKIDTEQLTYEGVVVNLKYIYNSIIDIKEELELRNKGKK